jgi:hypothetical protein
MVAAMVHDYAHPQVNNQYLIGHEDEMAIDFNNQSVAENFAVRETMKLMMSPECDFITADGGENGREKRQWLRNAVIQVVLATDMSRHFEISGHFRARILNHKDTKFLHGAEKWRAFSGEQRLLTLQLAMKVNAKPSLPTDFFNRYIAVGLGHF